MDFSRSSILPFQRFEVRGVREVPLPLVEGDHLSRTPIVWGGVNTLGFRFPLNQVWESCSSD